MAPARLQRPRRLRACAAAALLAAAVCLALRVAGRSTAWSAAARGGGLAEWHGRDRATWRSSLKATSEEVFVPDSSPQGKQVVAVYKQLLVTKNPDEVEEITSGLNKQQKILLKGLIEVRGSADRLITTTEPELGDTPPRLYKKMKMLEGDDALIAWRKKIDPYVMQEVQLIIEAEQCKLADAEAAVSFEDEAEAEMAYELFKAQFPKPAENEKYMTTPCRAVDIKYRFRRLKENLRIDSATALAIAEKDAVPFVVDPDYISRTWKAMIEACGGHDEALQDLVLKHPGSLIADPQGLKDQLAQAKITASVIDFMSSGMKFLRGAISDNGRRTFINARDEPALGGGYPAWEKKWKEEERQRKAESDGRS